MKRRNKEAVVRALFPFGQQHVDKLRDRIEVEAMQCDFELRTHDRASLLSTLFASLMILLPLGND